MFAPTVKQPDYEQLVLISPPRRLYLSGISTYYWKKVACYWMARFEKVCNVRKGRPKEPRGS